MGFKKGVKRAIRPFTNFKGWMDYDRTKQQTVGLIEVVKRLFVPREAQSKESFEQVVERYHMTEKDIVFRRRQYLLLTFVQLGLMAFLLIYGIRLLMAMQFPGGLVSIAFSGVMLSLAFRNHFWYFQIKKRKLGCSLREYFFEGLLRIKQ